ncbi:hypothetical protein [Rhizobium sp. BK251]|uniref:hypothetical protein n=1 Tax=Rhizobium sp. BK251 TaxID=2512125 RepID=UPI00104F01FA|nr:hypothetical protein [Rhizobium sp. BK251]TCL76182.1 hypothetical protein EV286_101730 [Rhizobium sp. BK251]
MDESKDWYRSKTIWGALLAVGASLVQFTGVEVSPGDQMVIADSAVSIAGAIGGLLAVYGRLTAKTAINQ